MMQEPKQASLLRELSPDIPRRKEPEKSKLLEFMRAQPPKWYAASNVKDPVTGVVTDIPMRAFDAGEWGWDSTELLLFERYDLALDPEFVKYALASIERVS